MVMIVLAAIGGSAVLLVLADLTDLLLVRAGKRSIFRRRAVSTGDVIGPTSAAGGDRPASAASDLVCSVESREGIYRLRSMDHAAPRAVGSTHLTQGADNVHG